MIARLSIRARIAIAFAGALLLILLLAGTFVYLRVSDSLTSTLDDRLEVQVAELIAFTADGGLPAGGLPGATDDEDGFSQLVRPGGEVVASSLAPEVGAALDAEALRRARSDPVTEELAIAGVDGEARVTAAPADGPAGELLVVAGISTEDRADALAGILGAFAIGGPLALLLAAGLGYLLAARSLAPVEAIRRRAGEITLRHSGERLPLPAADDEIRRLGETLNTMLNRIEGSLERERVFVADAAHELRTPLAVLRAELELALRPDRTPGEMRAALDSAAEEARRLSRLAEDLLVIARSDEGGLPIKREKVDLQPLLERVATRLEPAAVEAGRTIRVESATGLRADLDTMRIEQALGNLLDNALRHGEGEVLIAGGAQGESVFVEVSDDGPGFPPGFEAGAFERFSRADQARTEGGSGLGLAIVRAIAEAHGGSAGIGGGGGTTVRIELPAVAAGN